MIKKSIGLSASVFLLTACAVGPDYKKPEIANLPSQFTNGQSKVFSQDSVEIVWWKNFNDELLSTLIDKTLEHNYDMQIARANLMQARALYMNSELNFLPQVTSHSNFTDQKRSAAALNNRAFVPRTLSLYNAGFDAFWELDLFGRVRRSTEASSNELEEVTASLRDVSVSLIAEVARNYLELRGFQMQLRLSEQAIVHQEKLLELTQVRIKNGRGTEIDSATISARLEAQRATVPDLKTAIASVIHRLSVLTGQMPDALFVELNAPKALPTMPKALQIGNPADLLKRRADIQVAERALAADTERIGVATADLFPRVTFVGSLSLESNTLKGMVAPGAESYSLGPKISWAFLDLGRVYARISAADAKAQASLAQYHQTVLNALEETENALVNYRHERDKRVFLLNAVEASEKAHHLALLQFEAGSLDLLVIQESALRVLESNSQLAKSDTEVTTSLIAIYKSLGGGWENLPEKVSEVN